jgi:antitoxin (DNA-binding transcriptional repressor) of toxin-antitoxin stability system
MKQVTIEQASQRLTDLVDAAVNGEEVIVIRPGATGVRLVPVATKNGRPVYGSAKGLITISDDFDAPLDDLREYSE